MNVIVDSSSIAHNGFTLQWSPPGPEYQNGMVDSYLITVVEVETGVVKNYTSQSTTYYISPLHPAYTYQCTVAAYTVGLGPFSNITVVTTAEYCKWRVCTISQH